MEVDPAWIAVDWGTSNMRLWGLAQDGSVLFARSSDRGMGKLNPSDYPSVLAEMVGDHPVSEPPLEVLVCGMAGARQGWLEAPYLEAPADLTVLGAGSVAPQIGTSMLAPRILPGVCQKSLGDEDVMRGEETQLLGLSKLLPGFSGTVVMPGTHSKWVELEGRTICHFTTAMTGEIFEVMRLHSVLRHTVNGDAEAAERDAGFEEGLTRGLSEPARLTAHLFKARSAWLLSGRSAGWCSGLLSGLLIGAEIGGQMPRPQDTPVPLVGSPSLCGLYARGFESAGVQTQIIDATDATLAGLQAARENLT